jgi:NAD(P)-dependent dehydrogenase (short-subunit alcohol dehydrogenase family)
VTDRVAVVTGGSRGIGAAVVDRLLGAGYSVCFSWSQDEAAARELVERHPGGPLRDVRADVTDPEAVEQLLDAAEELGRITALVNNAGTTGRIGSFADLDLTELHRVLDVNLAAPVIACRAAVRRWRDAPGKRSIVNISSVAARTGAPGEYVPYAAAKAGVETLTVGLAKELGPLGIRVNAVAPGTTDTGIHALAGEPGRAGRVAGTVPMGRVARPDEVAATIVWLLSEEASYVSGAVLPVTGGL